MNIKCQAYAVESEYEKTDAINHFRCFT